MHFIGVSIRLLARWELMMMNVFRMRVPIGDTINFLHLNWRRDRHFTWSPASCEGLGICRAKAVPSLLSYVETLSIGLTMRIEARNLSHCSQALYRLSQSSRRCILCCTIVRIWYKRGKVNFHLLISISKIWLMAGLPGVRSARGTEPWNMVNLFSFGCHVVDRAYLRTYIRMRLQIVRVAGEIIKRKEGVSRAGVSWQVHIFNMGHSQYVQLTAVKTE